MTKKEFLEQYLTYSVPDREEAEKECERLNGLLTDCRIAVEIGFAGFGFTFAADKEIDVKK